MAEGKEKNSEFCGVKHQQLKENAAGYQHLYHLVGKHSDGAASRSSCSAERGRYQSEGNQQQNGLKLQKEGDDESGDVWRQAGA